MGYLWCMRTERGGAWGLILSPVFLGCLTVLLVNDLVLKDLWGGAVTGKLSDFAGLVVFALFFSALWPRGRSWVHLATAVLFVLYKSPLSQPLIDGFNGLGVMTISRVVDWTDLMALCVLPASWWWAGRSTADVEPGRRGAAWAAGALAVFAFVATSKSEPEEDADTETDVVDEEVVRDEVVLFGSCPSEEEVDRATDVAFTGLFHERWSRCSASSTPVEGMITDQRNWELFVTDANECMEHPMPAYIIDWDMHYVVVGGYAAWNTCGIRFDEGRVVQLSGGSQPHVEMQFTDTSGGADCDACTTGEGYVAGVAIPRAMGMNPTLCRRVAGTCE